MARSKIWKYYDKLDLQTAQCLLCEKIIKTCGNTSNLMKHMKTHPQIDVNDDELIVVRGMLKRESIATKTRGRKLLKYESIKIKSETSRQPDSTDADMNVNIIQLVDANTHMAVEGVVNEGAYTKWTAAETESATETVSAVDIIEFEPKEAEDHYDQGTGFYPIHTDTLCDVEQMDSSSQSLCAAYNDSLAYFLCRDKQPLHLIQGEGFKRLVEMLCPAFKLPSIDQLELRIGYKTRLLTGQLKQLFAQLPTLSLSCAIITPINSPTDNAEALPSYLEVAAHYHEGVQKRGRTISVQALPFHHNVSHIVERLERVCNRFNINKAKITCIVTRSNHMLESAVGMLLGNQRQVPCFAEFLETLFDSVAQRHEFTTLCDKVRRCIVHQMSFCTSSQQYAQLKLDVNGCVISSFDMLDGYVRHQRQINKWQSQLSEPSVLTDAEFELTIELLSVLAPLLSAARELCGSTLSFYSSSSTVLPITFTILNELKQAEHPNHQFSYDMRLSLIKQLEEFFERMETNAQLALSSLLDPRFRNMPFQSTSLLSKYMRHLYDLYKEKSEDGTYMETQECNTHNFDIWSAYRAISHEKRKHIIMNGNSENQDEISSYFCATISSLQTEPLRLWKDLSQFHPFLHNLAKKYLHIPASAVPPARLFTTVGIAKCGQHGIVFSDHMSFMSDCTEEEWQL